MSRQIFQVVVSTAATNKVKLVSHATRGKKLDLAKGIMYELHQGDVLHMGKKTSNTEYKHQVVVSFCQIDDTSI